MAIIIKVQTVRELRNRWHEIVRALNLDFCGSRRLAVDPRGTLLELGFDVGPDAERALLKALPH